MASNCHLAYEKASPQTKRLLNQAFFEKIFVVQIDESLAGVEINAKLKEPFDVLLGDELRVASQTAAPVRKSKRSAGKNANGPTSPLQVQGLSNALMVGAEGLEPPTC